MGRDKKFTPGPWEINDIGGPLEIYSKLKRWVCSMPFLPNLQGEENQANANLIAAAPELLQACEDIKVDLIARSQGYIVDCLSPEETIDYLESVIKKAYGETK